MSKLQKVLWLILIIIAIGAVAVATRTPNSAPPTAEREPSAQRSGPADTAERPQNSSQ